MSQWMDNLNHLAVDRTNRGSEQKDNLPLTEESSVEKLRLSTGTATYLRRQQIRKVGELLETEIQYALNNLTGIGRIRVDEIIQCLVGTGFLPKNAYKMRDLNTRAKRCVTFRQLDPRKNPLTRIAVSPLTTDSPVANMAISNRVYNALVRNGIRTVGQLLETKLIVIYELRNFGDTSFNELVDALIKTGFLPENTYKYDQLHLRSRRGALGEITLREFNPLDFQQ